MRTEVEIEDPKSLSTMSELSGSERKKELAVHSLYFRQADCPSEVLLSRTLPSSSRTLLLWEKGTADRILPLDENRKIRTEQT